MFREDSLVTSVEIRSLTKEEKESRVYRHFSPRRRDQKRRRDVDPLAYEAAATVLKGEEVVAVIRGGTPSLRRLRAEKLITRVRGLVRAEKLSLQTASQRGSGDSTSGDSTGEQRVYMRIPPPYTRVLSPEEENPSGN